MDTTTGSGTIFPPSIGINSTAQSTEKAFCKTCSKWLPLADFTRMGNISGSGAVWKTCNPCATKNRRYAKEVRRKKALAPAPQHQIAQLPLPNAGTPVQETEHSSVVQPASATPPKVKVFQGHRWQDTNILDFESISSLPVDQALTIYTMAIRLLEISHRWRPRNTKSHNERLDIVRETNMLLSLMDSGRINPWPPFRAWFEWYRSERSPHLGNNGKPNMAVFTATRVASEQLVSITKGEMEKAAEELKGLLSKDLPADEQAQRLEKFLAELKADIVEECGDVGCLGLKEILTEQDIKKARFSKSWKVDGI